MGTKLESKEVNGFLSPRDLRDGQIAIVIGGEFPHHRGYIVQRYGKDLIAIGENYGHSWGDVCTPDSENNLELRVLEDGEKIIVKDNK